MLVKGVLVMGLLIMLWQDWKYRSIHVLLPFLVFGVGLLLANNSLSYKAILVNAAFFAVVFGVLVLYMSIKAKAFVNPLTHYFGLGDILFYLAITPFFTLQQYAIFFISSMLFALLLQLATKKYSNHATVPLAGFSSLLLVVAILVDSLIMMNPKFTVL